MSYLTNNQRNIVHGIFKDDNWDGLKRLKKFFKLKVIDNIHKYFKIALAEIREFFNVIFA